MKKYLLLLCTIVAHSHPLFAQKSKVQSKESQVFIFRIPTIESFIHRFNNDSTGIFRRLLKSDMGVNSITRKESFESCFDKSNSKLCAGEPYKELQKFVLDSTKEFFLHFEDSNWYCKTKCHFYFFDKPQEFNVIFAIKNIKDKDLRWIIVGMDDANILNSSSQDTIIKNKKSKREIISASDYMYGFLDLNRIFDVTLDERTCFSKQFIASENGRRLINLIKEGKLKYRTASDLEFYFTQVPNFVLVVNDFDRATLNSGWLIKNIYKIPENYKANYRNRLLNIR
jgi:hypothetical protein